MDIGDPFPGPKSHGSNSKIGLAMVAILAADDSTDVLLLVVKCARMHQIAIPKISKDHQPDEHEIRPALL